MKYLLDSNIIIYYLNGEKKVYDFVERYKAVSAISLISYYEVLNYDFSGSFAQSMGKTKTDII